MIVSFYKKIYCIHSSDKKNMCYRPPTKVVNVFYTSDSRGQRHCVFWCPHGLKDELIRYWWSKVKGKGHCDLTSTPFLTMSQEHLGGILLMAQTSIWTHWWTGYNMSLERWSCRQQIVGGNIKSHGSNSSNSFILEQFQTFLFSTLPGCYSTCWTVQCTKSEHLKVMWTENIFKRNFI